MLYNRVAVVFVAGFLIKYVLLLQGIGSFHQVYSLNKTCIKSLKARVVLMDRETRRICLQVSWSVKEKYRRKIVSFNIFYLTNSGQSRSFSLRKKERSCSIVLPQGILRPENYTLFISCDPFGQKSTKSLVLYGREFCSAFTKVNLPAPFHCLQNLDIMLIRKCIGGNIKISWKVPNVTGFKGYLVRIAEVSCNDEKNCCKHAVYKRSFQMDKDSSNVTFSRSNENKQHCVEILMCPTNSRKNLNCELKHTPIFITCTEKRTNKWIVICSFALAILALVIFCIIWCRYKRNMKSSRKLALLSRNKNKYKNENKKENEHLKEASCQEPLLFIIFCAGCLAVEEYVLHLTQLFRLNGIHAVSELTEENEIRNLGHGVYLNKMLDQSDYILLLCTNVLEKSPKGRLYTAAFNTIQNDVVDRCNDLRRYIIVHFDQIDNVPSILRPGSINLSEDSEVGMERILRHMHGLESYCIDKTSIQKNEMQFSDKTCAKFDELCDAKRRLMSPRHKRCLKTTCLKGNL